MILLCAALKAEVQALFTADIEAVELPGGGRMPLYRRVLGSRELHILITGIGGDSASQVLKRYLGSFRPQLCLNAGSAAALGNDPVSSGPFGVERVCDERSGACLSLLLPEGVEARGLVSVDGSLQSEQDVHRLKRRFAADLADMECWTLALECYRIGLPFSSWKSVSDNGRGISRRAFKERLPSLSRALADRVQHYILNL